MHGRRTDPDELRRLIAERDLSLTEFALQARISRRLLTAALTPPGFKSHRDFSDRMAHRVAHALGVPLENFTVSATQDGAGDSDEDGEAA